MLNFDANASHNLLPEVKEAVRKWNYDFANPSAIHQLGQKSRALLEDARTSLKSFLNLSSSQRIVFTSGASEALTQAYFYAIVKAKHENIEGIPNIIIPDVEHPASLKAVANFININTDSVEINRQKEVRGYKQSHQESFQMDRYLNLVDANTIASSLMFANNETGLIYPVMEVFSAVKKLNQSILTICDAVQAIGKIPVDFASLQADFFVISAHKFGALTGTGALIVNDNLPEISLISGGAQELGWRAGTENLLGIYSMGIASEVLKKEQDANIKKMLLYKNKLLKALDDASEQISGLKVNFRESETLPNTISLQTNCKSADDLVVAMDLQGIAISSGSACSSGKPNPSHVLLAHGNSEAEARSTVRISFGADITENDLDYFIQNFLAVLRSFQT